MNGHYPFTGISEPTALGGAASRPPSVFVIGPFDEDATRRYEDLIKRPLEAHGFRVERADEKKGTVTVSRSVVSSMCLCTTVVADLTGLKPSVLYEIGLAAGLGRPVVLLVPNRDAIPHDLTQFFHIDMSQATPSETSKEIIENIEAHKSSPTSEHELTRPQRVSHGIDSLGIVDLPVISREVLFEVMRSAKQRIRAVGLSGRSMLVDSVELKALGVALKGVDVEIVLMHPESDFATSADVIDGAGPDITRNEVAVASARFRSLGMRVSYTMLPVPFGVLIVDDRLALVQFYYPGFSHTRCVIVEDVVGGMFSSIKSWSDSVFESSVQAG